MTTYDIRVHEPESWPLVGTSDAPVAPSLESAGDLLREYLDANPQVTRRYRVNLGQFWAEGSNGALLIRQRRGPVEIWTVGYLGPTMFNDVMSGFDLLAVTDAEGAARRLSVSLLDGPLDVESLWAEPRARAIPGYARPSITEAWRVRIERVWQAA